MRTCKQIVSHRDLYENRDFRGPIVRSTLRFPARNHGALPTKCEQIAKNVRHPDLLSDSRKKSNKKHLDLGRGGT